MLDWMMFIAGIVTLIGVTIYSWKRVIHGNSEGAIFIEEISINLFPPRIRLRRRSNPNVKESS